MALVRAKIVRPARKQSVLDFPWSSVAGGHALPPGRRPKWLASEPALAAFQYPDSAAGRREWVERLDRRAVEEEAERCGTVPAAQEVDARCSHLRRGWYWGSQAFAERMLKLAEAPLQRNRNRNYRGGLERKAHDASRAETLLADGMRAAGLDAEAVRRLRGSDARKVAVARVIWEQTTVPQTWLAERLGMGSAANVSQQLRRRTKEMGTHELPSALQAWVKSVNNC